MSLTNAQIVQTIENQHALGQSFTGVTVPLLQGVGVSQAQIGAALQSAGWSPAKIKTYTSNPGWLTALLKGAGQGVIPIPGVGGAGDTAAGAGATGGVAAGASAAAKVATAAAGATQLSQIWTVLGNPTHWLRALELLAGVVFIFMAIHSLVGGPTVSSVAAKVKP